MNINYFMKEAIKEANCAFNSNEVPVGGVLVDIKTCLLYTSPSPRDRG